MVRRLMRYRHNKIIYAFIGFIFLCFGMSAVVWKTVSSRPLCPDCNIILVSLDTLSGNHLPCYGYGRNTAPNLCAFGRENIMFESAYANAHFTLPSHVSMFTGLLPSTHHVNSEAQDRLSPSLPFLPSLLHDRGYESDFVMLKGDQHLPIDLVYNRGIDAIYGADNEEFGYWKTGLKKLAENEQKGKKTFLFLHTYWVHSPYLTESDKPLYSAAVDPDIPMKTEDFYSCTDSLISFLKTSLPGDLKKNNDPKDQRDLQRLYEAVTSTGDIRKVCRDYYDVIYNYRFSYFYSKSAVHTPEKLAYIEGLYDQKINELDAKLKMLFDFIAQDRIKNNTILIITADHGEEFMEHGEMLHKTLYDSNVRIPLFMYVPHVRGKTVAGLSQSIDLTPTILDLVGIPYRPSLFRGKSLAGAIISGKTGEEYAVAERMYDGLKTVRSDTYKLFLKQADGKTGLIPYELFDTKADPGEKNNVLFEKTDIVKLLRAQLAKITSASAAP